MANFTGVLSWWSRRQWRRGFDEAAGRLLRGEQTPEEVWLGAISGTTRDQGAQAALTALADKGVMWVPWSHGVREEWMNEVC